VKKSWHTLKESQNSWRIHGISSPSYCDRKISQCLTKTFHSIPTNS